MKTYELYSKRTKLIDQLPLDTPLGVHICLSTYCNFRCYYCKHTLDANGNKLKGKVGCLDYELMTMETFEIIVNQLLEFPKKIKLLNFAWLGEPLMNPNIADMVKLAKDKKVAETVSIVTNASLLTREMSDKLIEAGLDRLRISLQGLSAEDYLAVSSYKMDYSKLVDNIKYFYEKKKNTQVYIKIMDVMLKNAKDEEEFKEKFSDICDVINVEHLVPLQKELDISNHKSSFDVGYFGNALQENHICPYIFMNMMISPSGRVFLCSNADYINNKEAYYDAEISNIRSETLKNCWIGSKSTELRKLHIAGRADENIVCRECATLKYHISEEDRLDEYKEKLCSIYNVR